MNLERWSSTMLAHIAYEVEHWQRLLAMVIMMLDFCTDLLLTGAHLAFLWTYRSTHTTGVAEDSARVPSACGSWALQLIRPCGSISLSRQGRALPAS